MVLPCQTSTTKKKIEYFSVKIVIVVVPSKDLWD